MSATAEHLATRLREHRALSIAPEEELRWLAERAQLRTIAIGDVLVAHGQTVGTMWALLRGRVAFYTARGSGRGKIMEWSAGDLAGVLPFSRLGSAPGDAVVEEEGELVTLDPVHFPEMVRIAPEVTRACVHAMLDRARHFTKQYLQDEKLVSLGRLSAGLAHELNNPASAAARSAKLLGDSISQACAAARALGAAGLNEEQLDVVERVQQESTGSTTRLWSALDFSDREDVFEAWLEEHSLDSELTASLAETALTTSDLEELADALQPAQLDAAVHWIASEHAARALTVELQRAAERIHQLVGSVKRYTYMGRGAGAEPMSVAAGIEDTVTVMAFKARSRTAAIETEYEPDLPPILGFGGELNQVWHNLIDNALDAVPDKGGVVKVRAFVRRDEVVVEIEDNGTGIVPEKQTLIFDPFYTTKGVGQGSGLGLDIARRIVVRHNGEIEVESVPEVKEEPGVKPMPGRTVFRVTLPVAAAALEAAGLAADGAALDLGLGPKEESE